MSQLASMKATIVLCRRQALARKKLAAPLDDFVGAGQLSDFVVNLPELAGLSGTDVRCITVIVSASRTRCDWIDAGDKSALGQRPLWPAVG
jgi:hypothetical protein